LWEEAWAAIKAALEFVDDHEGEVATAFLTNMQMTYESAQNAEFGGLERLLDFLGIAASLVEARLSKESEKAVGGRKSPWRPAVLNNQRELLTLLKQIRSELPQVWEFILGLLAGYAGLMLGAPYPVGLEDPAGRFSHVAVSRQFSKEAADCLTQLYVQEAAVTAAKAAVFNKVLQSVAYQCIKCASKRRATPRSRWVELLGRHASRDAGVRFCLPQPVQLFVESGHLLTHILKHGLAASHACSDARDSLMRRWNLALLALEGYVIPWAVLDGPLQEDLTTSPVTRSDSSGAPVPGPVSITSEVQGEGYLSTGVELVKVVVEATLQSLDAALGQAVVDRLGDVLGDVVLAEAGVSGSVEGTEGASLTLIRAVLEGVGGLLAAVVARAGQPGQLPQMRAISSARRLVQRVLHACAWVLHRYMEESRCTDAPSRAYVTAEAHALLVLAFLQGLDVPAWALPDSEEAVLGFCPDWLTSDTPAPVERDEAEDVMAHERLAVSWVCGMRVVVARADVLIEMRLWQDNKLHIMLLSGPVISCITTGSSAVRSAVTDVLQRAQIGPSFSGLRAELIGQRRAVTQAHHHMASLKREVDRLSVPSTFF
jgi:hypothetical protein